MYVEMNVPKKRQSDPRKAHIASLRWSRPVLVSCAACSTCASWPVVTACSTAPPCAVGARFIAPASSSVDGLEAPGVDAEEHHQHADARQPVSVEHACCDQRQAHPGDERVV